MHAIVIRLLQNEAGQDLIEYALIIGMVALGGVGAMGNVAADVAIALQNFSQALSKL
jgi:Flp pilus assembly pilin Flp